MSEKNSLLTVHNLSVAFESYNAKLEKELYHAITDLSLELNKGEVLAVVGSSGSGKSLLAHAIMGILPENSRIGGEIFYDGEPLTPALQERLRGQKIAFIPQSVNFLDPLMKVGLQVSGHKNPALKKKMRQTFAHFGLKQETENLYPFQLSGGMARRVLLSTAQISGADLIIADEPTPGLDLELAVEALKDFRIMADNGSAILLITHDIDLALNVADKISIFHDGKVVETARSDSFSGNGDGLKHPYSRALFRALPQNDFTVDFCPHCANPAVSRDIDENGMRCTCDA